MKISLKYAALATHVAIMAVLISANAARADVGNPFWVAFDDTLQAVHRIADENTKSIPALRRHLQASPTVTRGDGFTQIDGEIFGAKFRLVRPDEWNGDLVMLLHGLVPRDAPLTLPPVGHDVFDPISDGLLARGYGVAYSSYRVNGYAVREGAADSRITQFIFSLIFGRPDDIYLAGFSMGTHIGQRLVETTPRRYAGFLATCAALGGSTIQTAYFGDARVLFDYFYPNVLPGDVLTSDIDFFVGVVPLVLDAITENPLPAIEMASVLGIRWTNPVELVDSIISSLIGSGGGTMDMQEKARGNPYDNSGTVYSGSSNDDALNGGIGRFIADPRAARYLQRYYDPRGTLPHTEVLHLHNSRDPIVPLDLHQPVYQKLLEENGDAERYFVRVVDRYGHCNIGIEEFLTSLDDLVEWSNTGVRPMTTTSSRTE